MSWIRRIAEPVLSPTPVSMRRIAIAGIAANTVIMSTGAAVRLSSSGLGCPDWPRCTRASIVASHSAGQTTLNTWIEFGNRLLNFPLVAVAAIVFIAAWRYRPPGDPAQTAQPGTSTRRKDLVWLAAAQPCGVVAQAVLGGILVLARLNPALVSVHFLLSSSIVGLAVVFYVRCTEGTARPRSLVRPDLRLLSGALVGVVTLMLAAGTVVTGTGPLAGNADAPRYHLPLAGVTQLHADIGWLMGGLAAALMLGLRLTGAPRRSIRLGWLLIAIMGVQGMLGYVQYFTGLPAGLVWVHVTTSMLVWISVLLLFFSLRDRGGVPGSAAEAEPAEATTDAGRAEVLAP
jgi:cytochrome c oxidase assembly protein subunit 15